ncbi:FkbM family methyltransferase [Legionella lytica]|uniref:FkbM family methyltransferase n=1 Tax=Legionella lytica TaxID=96232 RepID=A0ABY4Y9S3_9GAMM|nr:FkbM family methyltransferase [Legionella lytica]USQ14350.1 FkbM family methyltransferase [Legionella lytica]
MTNKKEFAIGELYYINELEVSILIREIYGLDAYLRDFLTLEPNSVVFDIGANIGIFSLYALYQCDEQVKIYSFEPIPATFECLRNNLASFGEKVQVYNMGIGNVAEECTVEFTLFGAATATATYRPEDKIISNFQPQLNYDTLLKLSSRRDRKLYYLLKYLPFLRKYFIKKNYKKRTTSHKVLCRLESLGRFIEKHNINHIDFLKVDVEGAEFEVIKSIFPHQFSNIKQLAIEVHDIEHRVEHMAAFLEEKGYEIKIYRSPVMERLGFNHHMIYAKQKEQQVLESH